MAGRQLISVDEIVVPTERQRKWVDQMHITTLMDSIMQRGLINAPSLRTLDDGTFVLATGGCRLKAVIEIHRLGFTYTYDGELVPYGQIPYTCRGQVSELEAREIEFAENAVRQDLTWQDKCRAINDLHELRIAQKEAMGEVQTIQDTVEELILRNEEKGTPVSVDYTRDKTRKSLLLAQHLDDPTIFKARSVDEGFKLLKKKTERQTHEAMAAALGATFSAQRHRAFQADCLAWMKGEAPEQFDVILTDPPYGINANTFGDAAGKLVGIDHDYTDSVENWYDLMKEWCPLAFKLAKPAAHAYVFCDIDQFFSLREMMQAAGWGVFRTPFIYYKINSGRVPLPEHGPRRQYEMLLYAIKGNRPVTFIYPDVIPGQGDENLGHGAQKPVSLFQNLLQRSARPGDTVLDTFAGSGTIFPAAHSMKVIATGIERKSEYHGICLQRLKALEREEELTKLVEG